MIVRIIAAVLAAAALAGVSPAVAAPSRSARSCQVTRPLGTTALAAAIAGLPSADVTAALVRATGPDGCWEATTGVADLRTGAAVPQGARFRIGSVTKVFTAVVALQLVAEHRIELDGAVQRYLPGVLPPDYPTVTVRQLLNHTSGLPSPVLADESVEYSDRTSHRAGE